MDNGCRYAVLSWHRRGGKDVTCFSYMVRKAMEEVGTYYYCFPTLEDGKEILWNNSTTIDGKSGFMVDLLCPKEIVANKNNQDYMLKLVNGSVIRIKGTDTGKVVGNDGKGFVFSEWQNQKEEVFSFIRPIIRQNNGWAVFNGTMRGKENHLYKDIVRNKGVKGWLSQWLKPEDTKQYYWVSPEDEDPEYKISVNPELEGQINPETGREYDNIQLEVDSGMSYAKARQEYLNEAVSDYEGTYFSYELQVARRTGRIGHFGGINKSFPVSTSWDLGISDNMAITIVQELHGRMRIVGYIEQSGQQYSYFFEKLRKLGVRFAGHYVPHDAKKRSGENLNTFVTVARDGGFNVKPIPKTNSVRDDIEICRQQWKGWEIDLDGEGCELLYDHLTKYRENLRTKRPDHSDDSSNGGDSVRTIMMARHRGIYSSDLNSEYREDELPVDEIDEYYSGNCLDIY